jgi:hypothetical protein
VIDSKNMGYARNANNQTLENDGVKIVMLLVYRQTSPIGLAIIPK